MGKCISCGKDAGFLRAEHQECKDANERGRLEIVRIVMENASRMPADTLRESIATIAASSFVNEGALRQLEIGAWETAVAKSLEERVPTPDEERSLVSCAQSLGLDQDQLDANGAFSKLVKAAVIRDLLDGKVPYRMKVEGRLPFNFQKGEEPVWVFKQTRYYEETTSRRMVGSYSGVSARVAKGVYFRTGGFRGNPVVTTSKSLIDTGMLALTERNLYFAGARKAFRIPYHKVVAFQPYNDGIGIQRDAQSAKPQLFGVGDGWFVYNLVINLANLEKA